MHPISAWKEAKYGGPDGAALQKRPLIHVLHIFARYFFPYKQFQDQHLQNMKKILCMGSQYDLWYNVKLNAICGGRITNCLISWNRNKIDTNRCRHHYTLKSYQMIVEKCIYDDDDDDDDEWGCFMNQDKNVYNCFSLFGTLFPYHYFTFGLSNAHFIMRLFPELRGYPCFGGREGLDF